MSNLIVTWPGNSGIYNFEVFYMTGDWNSVPGIYIFAKETSPSRWTALYVGETQSFQSRLSVNHDEWSRAVSLGATHVHAMQEHGGQLARRLIESDLILKLDPPLNQKLSRSIADLLYT